MSKKIQRYRVIREKGCGRGMWDVQIARESPNGRTMTLTGKVGASAAVRAQHDEMVRDLNAAPILLEALESALEYVERFADDAGEPDGGDCRRTIKAMRKAIEKATRPH